jgi:hypothetical protein
MLTAWHLPRLYLSALKTRHVLSYRKRVIAYLILQLLVDLGKPLCEKAACCSLKLVMAVADLSSLSQPQNLMPQMLMDLGKPTYEEDFEADFLKAAGEFYAKEAQDYMATSNAPEYMLKVTPGEGGGEGGGGLRRTCVR